MHEAVAFAQRGDEQHALALIGAVLSHHPAFVPALKLQGALLEETGHDVEAALSFRKALNYSPNDAEMLLRVGTNDLVTGHTDEAIKLLERRIRAVPGDEEGNYYLAQAYHLKGNNDLALTAIRKALKASPNDAPILQKYGELLCSSGVSDEALQWLKKAQNVDPSLARINFDLAIASYNSMDLKAAAEYATIQAALQPKDVDNLILLASVQVKLAQWQEAKGSLQTVLTLRQDDAPSILQLGHCELELKNYQASIDALNRSLQLDPTQVQAHYLLSRAYNGLGNTAEAQHEAALHREMMQHVSFNLTKAEANRENSLSDQARQLLADGHEAEALQLFEDSTEGPSTTRGSARVSVGATYLSLGNSEAAERNLRHALELDPRTRGAHTYLGILALQQGNLSQAETSFEAELALDPNHPLALGELGEVRYHQRRWAEASELLTKSKTTIPALLYMLCDSDFQLGKTQAAELTAEALAAYGKNEPTIMQALTKLLRLNGHTELADRLAHQS
ncbi:tetratricopeptide repeat protein [Tunturiibacter lichenicola]|uniref:tetratricopeptide repeat protein n=1 Tax=Tunturiibacter lichenicola TaxID=2051959 RepID=UPI0021B2DAC6|nr:tetratricopeptide repeat protein [Edaphobacter lichenicola]